VENKYKDRNNVMENIHSPQDKSKSLSLDCFTTMKL